MRIYFICLFVFLGSLLPSLPAIGQDRAANVLTAPIQFEFEQSRIEAVGNAEAIHSVVLYPAVGDRVTAVHFTPGDSVKAGDVLLELDARRQKVAVERAKIVLQDLQRTVERLKKNRQEGAIAQSVLDDALTNHELAKVALREAQVELEDRYVRAPFDGVVGITDVEVGDRISINTPITSIDDRRRLYVDFRVPESALALLDNGAKINLAPWQGGMQQVPATIEQVDSRIDATNRTLRIRAIVENQQDKLRPGMSFRVNLELHGGQFAAIPESALQWGATGAYIWLVEDGKAKRVDVQIKQRLRGRLLVDGSLTADSIIIQEGVQSVREGQQVADNRVRMAK